MLAQEMREEHLLRKASILLLGAQTSRPHSAQGAQLVSGIPIFALRAQGGRGRPRSQQVASGL